MYAFTFVLIMETNAKGTTGYIIKLMDGRHMFRVYDHSNIDEPFVDYVIAHHDLEVTITDADAVFLRDGYGNGVLDYSKETLRGKSSDT